jgi:uncharacterized repeat protein (TIGR02543 family)
MKLRLLLLLLLTCASIISAQVPTNGLQSQYKFTNGALIDETSNEDLVKTGNSLTTINGISGDANNAVRLNGDYLKRNSQAFNDFSISFSMKTAIINNNKTTIIDQSPRTNDAEDNNRGWYIYLKNGKVGVAGNFSGSVSDTFGGEGYSGLSSYQDVESITNISDNQWHQITITFDESVFRGPQNRFWRFSVAYSVYVDKVLDNSQSFSINTNSSSANSWANNANVEVSSNNDITIANNNLATLNNVYVGNIDEVLIYNRLLSTSDIELITDASGFCFKPNITNLKVTEKTLNSIKLNLTGGSSYDIAYHKTSEPFSNSTIINNIVAGEITVPNLDSSTDYSFYYRKVCSTTSNSDWSDAVSDKTLSKIFVDASASGNNDGSSWIDAFTNLKDALANNSDAEIWVKKGIYIPGNTRGSSFVINNIQKIYGGFNGTETMLAQRNPTVNKTTLSGDLNADDSMNQIFNDPLRSENSFNVVKVNGSSSLLDGFTISGGHSNGGNTATNNGSGILISSGVTSFTLKNAIIEENVSSTAGAIFSISRSISGEINIDRVLFQKNLARLATCYYSGNVGTNLNYVTNITNSILADNETNDENGANGLSSIMWIRNDLNGATNRLNINSSTIANNKSLSAGIVNAFDAPVIAATFGTSGQTEVYINNTILWNNTNNGGTIAQAVGTLNGQNTAQTIVVRNSTDSDNFSGITDQMNTLRTDPQFKVFADSNYGLLSTSPAVDSGDNTYVALAPFNTDFLGFNRIVNNTIDRGAIEFGNIASVKRTLTITATNGVVSTNPNPTNGTYDDGTSVSLTATPDAGYQFDGWSGDATGNTNPLTITMDADKAVTAMFSKIQKTLTITATNGVVATNPNPTNGAYDDGTSVSLTATPDAGYQFDGWSGDATGNTNPLAITMDADKAVTAMFSKIQRTLTITATNGTVISNPSPINGTYDNGTIVTLTGTADAGFGFVNWSGDSSATTNTITITMDADKNLVANFSSIASADDFNRLDFKIYPNPAASTLNIEASFTIDTISIFNLLGQIVLESNSRSTDISNLKSGMYLIKVKSERGSVATKRFVKK